MGGALCVAEADGVGHRVRHAQHLQPAVRLRGQQQPRQILGAEARTHAPRAQLEQRLDVARLGPYLRHEPGAAKRVALEAAGDVLGAAAHERAAAQGPQVAALDLRAVRREIDPAGL